MTKSIWLTPNLEEMNSSGELCEHLLEGYVKAAEIAVFDGNDGLAVKYVPTIHRVLITDGKFFDTAEDAIRYGKKIRTTLAGY